ncbi:MAG: tetratricopeptide repeat-containing glycosyltransferase family protein [Aureliella sp.]
MNRLEQTLSRGWQIHQQKDFKQAEQIYRSVLNEAPQSGTAWCYLGIALHDQRCYDDAVAAYRRALELQPNFPIALNNLGNSLRYIDQYEQADRCFERALELKPDYSNAYKNRGTLHVWTGNLDRGQAYYEKALAINPQEAELHRNLGVIYLLKGDFDKGWREYRWRWRVGDLQRSEWQIPVWDASDLAGKSILLTAEQGLGDTLHFVRMAKLLQARGAKTIVHCQAPLLALLQTADGLGTVFPNNIPWQQPVDWQCSLLDVADLLELDADSIPHQVPYLRAAPQLQQYWQQRMPSSPGTFRVGISWQGNPDHQADAYRSLPLTCFEGLAAIPNVELISLQQGAGREQIGQWQGVRPLSQLPADVDQSSGAFMDTAAIMHTLDLVITSDTAIAHLAGALGIPTWIALGFVPDWRWLLNRDDSPWYPSVRLFRQSRMGDWSSVFKEIAQALNRVKLVKK